MYRRFQLNYVLNTSEWTTMYYRFNSCRIEYETGTEHTTEFVMCPSSFKKI